MNQRTYGTVGAVAVVLVAAAAVVSAGGVPLGGDDPVEATETPGQAANATTIDHAGDRLSLDGAPNQTVAGETDLAPGTELAVRIVSDEADSPFLVTQTATVDDDGTFAATVDLAHVSEDAAAWATVVRDGAELANVSARITAVEGATPTDGPGESESGTNIAYEGDRLTLAALENETIRGESDLAAGTEVTVRLASSSSSSPFLMQETATVAEDGTFVASVDLVGVANGTTFEATVRHDGESVADADGVVIGGQNDVSPVDESDGNRTAVPVDGTDDVDDHNTTLDYDGETLTLEAGPNQSVAGETDLDPGTNVSVRLRSTGGNPFLVTSTATVAEDGRFDAEFNMTAVSPGATFEVTVRHDDDRIATADGEVVE
ncbi:BGTF surface domain-containing protein [Halosimplex salinum]|uniref:BGTF surface domain-containing protein n=1 Tax=Halosimplex salinum TaxID=1710538 RepID=UPI000F480DB5|nr:BGTF surface domain-containing protein [Halosimplex salinum]